MKRAKNILIAGFGDIGKRVALKLRDCQSYRVVALVRQSSMLARDPKAAKTIGVRLLKGDLGSPRALHKLAGRADTILHFAPPPGKGQYDSHTEHLLSALDGKSSSASHKLSRKLGSRMRMLPRRLIYIGTTGVYGNCDGEFIDERRPLRPESARARRRVDAEKRLRKWGREHDVAVTILRSPGIYAEDRLPLDRLKRRTPVLAAADDVFTNHIHADDLASAVIKAMLQRWPKSFRVFNVVDDSQLKMGDYFDQVADTFGLARPSRLCRREAEQIIAPVLLSFMRESRRIGNTRAKRELKMVLRYPTITNALEGMQPAKRTESDQRSR